MKGIIFTEFMQLVEEKFGLEVLDAMLDRVGDEGIYTSVGSYGHGELVKLIMALSDITGVSATDLQQVFGESVFVNLYNTIPNKAELKGCNSAFQFVRHVEEYIHVEVKKLYPDAKPPAFEFISENKTEMVFDYRSARCMSHVCFGLIKGCAKHFNEQIEIEMTNTQADGQLVRFALTKS